MPKKKGAVHYKKPRPKVDLIGRALEIPPGTVGNGAHIEISTNKEALVDGCRGIMEYDEDKIKLNIGNGTVTFLGRGLHISSLGQTQAIIRGFILNIEFSM